MILKLNLFGLGRHYHWEHAVFLYTHYDEYDQAANTMMAPSSVHHPCGALPSGSGRWPWRHWGSQPNCVCPWPVEYSVATLFLMCTCHSVLSVFPFRKRASPSFIYLFISSRGSSWPCRRQPALFFVLSISLIASTQIFQIQYPRWPWWPCITT